MTDKHPGYGSCDGFGPGGECSECTGLIECGNGSVVPVRPPPTHKATWRGLLALEFGAPYMTEAEQEEFAALVADIEARIATSDRADTQPTQG